MIVDSPAGRLRITATASGLASLSFVGERAAESVTWEQGAKTARILRETAHQLSEYFERKRRDFKLPLAPRGTEFQLAVWRGLRRIPYGTTISYGELARRLGNPESVRAVAAANGANPIAIIVPCHRVIGADGSLTGYGGGLRAKKLLLELEHGIRSWL
jgi:methylated-DNA-[protein]-cysteine S-methyltransferase